MATGTQVKVTVSRNANGSFGGIDEIKFTRFDHDGSFTTTSDVKKNDVVGSEEDKYVVTTNWASGDTGLNSIYNTVAVSPGISPSISVAADALNKVNTAFPGTFS